VGYTKINTCQGEMRAEISDKNSPARFHIIVVMKGFFVINGEIPKEQLHVKTFDALFPHLKAYIVNLTATAGIPPVYIPYVDISNESIYRVEMPGNLRKKEEEE
jgi:preprotein translocase subunit SecB